MEYKDYYQILGIPRTATTAEIKRAYRKLARQHHPDLNKDPAAEQRFKEANEANAVLSDPVKRQRYDTLGPDWEQAGAGAPFGGGVRYQRTRSNADLGDFSDFFRAFFGEDLAHSPFGSGEAGGDPFSGLGARPTGGGRRVALPLEATAELTLEEAFAGASRLAEVEGKRLEVKIPAGVDSGARVRLAGGAGGGRDLVVAIVVRPHPMFTRRGADLERDLALTLAEALLGAKVAVRTLKGQVMLTVPAGTQNGQVFRLAGQGMPRLGKAGAGDLRVRVRVVLPTKLSETAKQAAKRLGDLVKQPDPRT